MAVARSLALKGVEVLVLERASSFGTETSSRNSEVIHAGVSAPPVAGMKCLVATFPVPLA